MLEELSKEKKFYKPCLKMCKKVLNDLNSAKDKKNKLLIISQNPEFENILICSRYLNFTSLLWDNIVIL